MTIMTENNVILSESLFVKTKDAVFLPFFYPLGKPGKFSFCVLKGSK